MKLFLIITTAVLLIVSSGCSAKLAENQSNALPVPVTTPTSNVNSNTIPAANTRPSPTQSGADSDDPSFMQKMEQQQRESKEAYEAQRKPGSNSNSSNSPGRSKPLPPGQKVF
jgi:hypothetical protein